MPLKVQYPLSTIGLELYQLEGTHKSRKNKNIFYHNLCFMLILRFEMSETLSIPGTSDPCDPNDPFYKRVCFVCSEEAKPNQEHLRNYGAIVCLSCRAFFR